MKDEKERFSSSFRLHPSAFLCSRPLIERLGQIARDSKAAPREATSAAKAVLTAGKNNLDNISIIIYA